MQPPPRSISARFTPRCRPRSSRARKNPLAIISTAKLYEVQKFCSLTNHIVGRFSGSWRTAAPGKKLPEDVRTIVAKNINAAAVKEREGRRQN